MQQCQDHWQQTIQEVLQRGIMVDVETAGPTPSRYALLSLGGCVIAQPDKRFYIELQPDRREYIPAALEVTGLSLTKLQQVGTAPQAALNQFGQWVAAQLPHQEPLFVAHNAAFDWMFYADYCGRYQVPNPFGYTAFDTKAAFGHIMQTPLPHHAGEDAYLQTLDLWRFIARVKKKKQQ